ncbi:SCO family protein [Dechloromonas sp.]|uniref:SCO family protein n=1 Tax=Dechloromonas sp. TaxID=1917218 RepID=UPI001222CE2A|nr:SCO family protein [Dechloromonas sp.]MBU3697575.1 SCO family protein [Dechloromonas sp.]TEX48122.1 MAG: electron transport protein SCO1/SenC [Rhodocyclaceae bacterium]
MSERILTIIAGLLAAVVLGLAIFWQPELPERPLPRAAGGPPGGDFTLQSAAGPVSLADYRGKLVLVYFGYTYCPDVCPTSLAATSEGLKQLTPAERARVAMIFVSVDPRRDTPARLKEYVEFFDPGIVGVTGTPQALSEIAAHYGVFYAEQKVATAGDGYVVDHTSDTYVIDAAGKLAGKIAHATPPDQVVVALRQYLKQP